MGSKVKYLSYQELFLRGLFTAVKPKEFIVTENQDLNFLMEIVGIITDNLIPFTDEERNKIYNESTRNEQIRFEIRSKQEKIILVLKEFINLQNTLIKELKEKYNPDTATITAFFKCFYYRSVSEFYIFQSNEEHLKAIERKANLFEGKVRDFFLEKILEVILFVNQNSKEAVPISDFAERFIRFERDFQVFFNKTKDTEHNRIIDPNPETPVKNPKFTLNRQILAIYYLLEYVKIDRKSVDRTNLARFTQFLTGRESMNQTIKNTDIYKRWGRLFSKTAKKNKQDLNFIKAIFRH